MRRCDFTPERRGSTTRRSDPTSLIQPQPIETSRFQQVIQAGNKFQGNIQNLWKFKILHDAAVVGYMQENTVRTMNWTNTAFYLDEDQKIVHLNPGSFKDKSQQEVCKEQFVLLLEINRHRMPCFARWRSGPTSFFPIACQLLDLRGTQLPVPMRGIFGIVTYGIHLNVYTTRVLDGKTQTCIWVAERAQTTTFPGMLDQVVAGAVDNIKPLEPLVELEREAKEEADWDLDKATMRMFSQGQVIGTVVGPRRLTFYDKKDSQSGTENGHLEPGVRFVFDIELDQSFVPKPNCEEETRQFMLKSLDEVKAELLNRKWKPNSALAMLHSLIWNGHISMPEEHTDRLLHGLQAPLPLPTIA